MRAQAVIGLGNFICLNNKFKSYLISDPDIESYFFSIFLLPLHNAECLELARSMSWNFQNLCLYEGMDAQVQIAHIKTVAKFALLSTDEQQLNDFLWGLYYYANHSISNPDPSLPEGDSSSLPLRASVYLLLLALEITNTNSHEQVI